MYDNAGSTPEASPNALIRVLAAQFPSWAARTASQALIGWLVYASTGSSSLVAVSFALRFLPLATVGVAVGALSDRFGASRLLWVSNVLNGLISIVIAAAAAKSKLQLGLLLSAATGYGLGDAARMVSGQNLTFHFAGRLGAMRAIALLNIVSGFGQALGGTLVGIGLGQVGPSPTALSIAAAYGGGALISIGLKTTSSPTTKQSILSSISEGLHIIRTMPLIRVLIVVALVIEVFAFSGTALDPVFAVTVFAAGPGGLGAILTARAIGRMSGASFIAVKPQALSIGRWLTVGVLLFGTGLMGYAIAPTLRLALVLTWATGVAGAIVDALEQTGMQGLVSSAIRGRSTGLWLLAVGLGPVGALEIGIVAQAFGPRFAQLFNGLLVASLGLLLFGRIARTFRSIGSVGRIING